MEVLTLADVNGVIAALAAEIETSKERLCALDAAAGDGDLGVTMVLGFRAAMKQRPTPDDTVGSVLVRAGAAFNSAAPSSMGALLGTALIKAGQDAWGLRQVGLPEIASMARAAERGLHERSKAQLGDKTVLDSFIPAAEALAAGALAKVPLREALESAAAAAERGMNETAGLRSKVGRAAFLGERTVGNPDAGAACFCLMLRTAIGYVDRNVLTGKR